MPNPTALTEDATIVYNTVVTLSDGVTPGNGGQRFVSLLAVRAAAGLPWHRFDAAVHQLADSYTVELRVAWSSTWDEDEASIRRNGTDYHHVTADDWRLRGGR